MSECARARRRVQLERIAVRFVVEGREGTGWLKNVSRGGLFVRTPDVPAPGLAVVIQFQPPEGEAVNLRGEVRWSTEELPSPPETAGFGVLLHEPPREYRAFFLWVLEQTEKPDAD